MYHGCNLVSKGIALAMKKLLILALLVSFWQAARGSEARYTVVTVDPARDDLRIFLADESGQAFKRFSRLAHWLSGHELQLAFATNAGMYHHDFRPVGLLVQDGKELAPLNLAGGYGNFFLKPNGVFLVSGAGAQVVESGEYPALAKGVRLATQSGPLLLRKGVMHPAFLADASSRHIRNGVGIVDGKALFVISEQPVTLYEFAAYFRDLKCQDALYLDGSISSLYSLALGRNDERARLGPILGVVREAKAKAASGAGQGNGGRTTIAK